MKVVRIVIAVAISVIINVYSVNIDENQKIEIHYINAKATALNVAFSLPSLTSALTSVAEILIAPETAPAIALAVAGIGLIYATNKLKNWYEEHNLIDENNHIDINQNKVIDALPLPDVDSIDKADKLTIPKVDVDVVNPTDENVVSIPIDDVIPNITEAVDEAIENGRISEADIERVEISALPNSESEYPPLQPLVENHFQPIVDYFSKISEALDEERKQLDNQTTQIWSDVLSDFKINIDLQEVNEYPKFVINYQILPAFYNNNKISFLEGESKSYVIDTSQYASQLAIIRSIIITFASFFTIAIILSRN